MDKVPWHYVPMVLFMLYWFAGAWVALFVGAKEVGGLTRVPDRKFVLGGLIYIAGLLILYVISLLALSTERRHIDPKCVFLSLICIAPPMLLHLLGIYLGRRRLDAMRKDK